MEQSPFASLRSLAEPEAAEALDRAAAELGAALPAAQRDRLLALGRLLEQWSQRLNLTGHRTPFSLLQRMLAEPLALHQVLPPFPSLADLGSGAGFPGLPLAILRPTCRVTLVESRQKRVHFQRAAVRQLALGQVRALRGRAEELPGEPHAAVIAQAVAAPATALPWMRRWAAPGALLLFPGGSTPPEVPALPDLEGQPTLRYRVPLGGPPRTLAVARLRPGR